MSRALGSLERTLRLGWPWLSLSVVLVALVVLCDLAGDTLLKRTLAEALIKVVVVVGIYIFMGNSGVLAFSNTTFMMIAAYASAWLTLMPNLKRFSMPGLPDFVIEAQLPPLAALLLGAVLASFVALVIGAVILRLSGIAASIASFAVLAMGYTIYSNWDSVTMGTSSVIGLPIYVDMHVALVWAIIAMGVALLYQISRFGLALRASREDEVAGQAYGVNVYRERLIAYTLGAFVLGIGGGLQGHFLGILTVEAFYLQLAFITIAMLVVGGQGSLTGAVVGVFVVSIVTEVFRRLEKGVPLGDLSAQVPLGAQEIILGLIMLLILVYRPRGLMRGREIPWPFGKPVAAKRADLLPSAPRGAAQ
jgi:branched-chain amino acid transport system permease protein